MEINKLALAIQKVIIEHRDMRERLAQLQSDKPDAIDLDVLVGRVVAKVPTPRDGLPGVPGRDATVDYGRLTKDVLALIPTPKDGKDGKDAKPVDEQGLADAVFARVPKPKDGRDATVDYEKIVSAVAGRIPKPKVVQPQAVDEQALEKRILAQLPKPKDGASVEGLRLSKNNTLFAVVGGEEIEVGQINIPNRQNVGGGGGGRRQKPLPVNGRVSFVEILRAQSVEDQEPSTTNTPLVLNFGPAQGGPSDPVELAADGTLTFNKTAQYAVRFAGQYGRTGSAGTSWLYFRTLIAFDGVNFVQVGRTVLAKFQNSNNDIPIENFSGIVFQAGWKTRVEVMRGDEGINDGGLLATTPSEGTWATAPSTEVVVQEIIWEQT